MASGVIHEGFDRRLAELGGSSERYPVFPKQFEGDQAGRFPGDVVPLIQHGGRYKIAGEFDRYERHILTLADIGAAARVVANFGLCDFRLVDPYDVAFREAVSAVGGVHVLQGARVFGTLTEAVGDCSLVVGTTASQRRVPQQPVEVLARGMGRVRAHRGRVALVCLYEWARGDGDDEV